MYRCKWMYFCTPSQSWIPPIPKTVEWWLEMTSNGGQVYGTFMYEGPSPLPDGISHSLVTNTSGEGPTHLKSTVKV